ncbi:DUF6193 family natural product biosynthesis protein [Streptomyces sp. NPDC050418]|uniref:DUF6193 family natural product biosynthesis protein n=1 Tax=Streptomyces sp. NPDC050418 TaxID=3365612 RepID=UPI00379B559F
MNPPENNQSNWRIHYYPDIVEAGGVREALASLSREGGNHLTLSAHNPENNWSIATFASPRGDMRVNLGTNARRFSITLSSGGRGFVWACGSTDDLPSVAEVMKSWKSGLDLRGLRQKFPFMQSDRLSQAYEDGNPEEVQWDILINDPNFSGYRDLLLALREKPTLRELFPFISHWTLGLRRADGSETENVLWIRPRPNGAFTVWTSSTEEQRREWHRIDDLVMAASTLAEEL